MQNIFDKAMGYLMQYGLSFVYGVLNISYRKMGSSHCF